MSEGAAADRHFILRRLHSLSGVVPLGAYVLFHLFENASARRGAEAFNQTVRALAEIPYLYALEILLIGAPILYHGIYGLYITSSSRPNIASYPYGRNWAYFWQRLSGVIAFAFILFHVWTTRVDALFFKQRDITFQDMHLMLSRPEIFALYAIGVLAVVYHFANGLWSFSITWGLVRTRAAQRRMAGWSVALFVFLSIISIDIMSAFVWESGVLWSAAAMIREV